MEPMEIVGKSKEDVSLPKGFRSCSITKFFLSGERCSIFLIKQWKKLYIVAMAKPSLFRAEKSMAPDLSTDRISYKGAPTRRGDLVFIINSSGANGRIGKEWKKLLPYLRSRLGSDCNAIREGADAVVAVGGDGTLHEVYMNKDVFSDWFLLLPIAVAIGRREIFFVDFM